MLGFIGTGNMATAIIKGIVSSGFLKGEEICVFDVIKSKADELNEKYGVSVCESLDGLAAECDAIVLSVKPNVFPTVLSQISEKVNEKKPLIISIAAGKTLEFIGSFLDGKTRIVRVMPNINAVVGEAVCGYCGNENATEADMDFVKNLCSCFGKAVALTEDKFPIFGVIGGCSPAYAYMFIDSLARAAVKNGMPKAQALEVSAQAVLGSAKMILESGEHPWELIDKVCSPGGTTIEGVLALQKDGFEAAVADAVESAFEKDRRL